MSVNETIQANKVIQALRQLRSNISVSNNFYGQMQQINKLLKSDESGFVTPILDFMVNTSATSFKIETKSSYSVRV